MLLELFRDHKRLLMFVAMILVIPSFVVTGIYSYNRMMTDDGAIAKIDGRSVTPADFDQAKRQRLDFLRARLGDAFRSDMLDSARGRWGVLLSLLNERALSSELARQFVSVPEQVAVRAIKEDPAFSRDGKFSPELYQSYLSSTGWSDAYFVERARRDISRRLLTAALERTSEPPRSVVSALADALSERRVIQTMTLPTADRRAAVTVSEEEAREYWREHQDAFTRPDEVDVEYVVFSADLFRDVTPSEEDIEVFYQQNRDRFAVPEERRASHILIDPKDGSEVARARAAELADRLRADPSLMPALAAESSADPGSAREGGDLGFFARGVMVRPFEDAVFAAREGEVVGPVESEFGWHVILVTGIRPERVRTLAEARDEIVGLYRERRALEMFGSEAEDFTNMVYEQADSLRGVSEKFGMPIRELSGLTRDGSADPAAAALFSDRVVASVFAPEVLREGANTPALEVGPAALLAARVKSFRPAHVVPFEEARERAVDLLTEDRARELALADGREALAALRRGEGRWDPAGAEETVSRGRPGPLSPALLLEVTRLPSGSLPAFVGRLEERGYTIVRAISGDRAEVSAEQLRGLTREISEALALAGDDAWYAGLRRAHGATVIDPDYLPDAPDRSDAERE